jgi:lysophospholipase L1-like esterase
VTTLRQRRRGVANQASHSFYYRTGVDVTGGRSRNTVVTFGDSITNGHNSTVGGNDRFGEGETPSGTAKQSPAAGVRRGGRLRPGGRRPANPEQLNPAYNSGDFLHPNDAGYRAIAASIEPNEL